MSIINSIKSLKGVSVPHRKNTQDMPFIELNDFDEIKIIMKQHMGVVCTPLVKVNDTVKVGQVIGKSDSDFSSIIHASCSGVVKRIEDIKTSSGETVKAVIIENDKNYELSEDIKAPTINNKQDFINAIKNSGVVGLGGAGFPTNIKLDYKGDGKITKLIVNCAECEPYITSDYRECLENTDNILLGIENVRKYLEIEDVYFGIEANKPIALQLIDEKTQNDDHFHVVKLKQIYPQGAEKSIIYATTGVTVTAYKLPADCGCLVMNVSTLGFIGSFIKTGIPLVKRKLTIDGDAVKKPQNIIVPIGASVKDVLIQCDCDFDLAKKIIMGGPMMGICVNEIDTPIIKNNNAILAFTEKMCKEQKTTPCIRCGKCIEVCPMNLMPAGLEKAYDSKNIEKLEKLNVNLCINCGCCSYICPAKRPLAQKHQLSKILLRNKK